MSNWPKLSPTAVEAVCRTKDGQPDMYNYMPTRLVPQEEAEFRGWKYFYVGSTCRWGHLAPRYVSNANMCVDCHRIRANKPPMGAKGHTALAQTPATVPKAHRRGSGATAPAATVLEGRQPDPIEKKFIVEYAKTRSFRKAAEECGRSEAEFLGRLSYDTVFRAAVHTLEADNNLCRTPALNEDFEWSDDKRVVLMRTYINTGDLAQAMRSISVANFHFEKEMDENAEFRADMERAEKLAWKQIDRTAISLSVNGDSRLLQRVLAGNIEKYGERVKVDMNVTQKLTDEQLNERLAQAYERIQELHLVPALPAPVALNAEFSIVGKRGEAPDFGGDGAADTGRRAQSNLDLV